MIKPSKVVFADDRLENIFNLLPDEDPLKKGIIKAIRDIRRNCLSGEVAKKGSVILKNYEKKYGIKNLRVYDLPLSYKTHVYCNTIGYRNSFSNFGLEKS